MTQTLKDFKQELKKKIKEKNFDQWIIVCQEALRAFPGETYFEQQLLKGKEAYIHNKLQSELVKELESKEDNSTLYMVYQKLLQIFPESMELKKLIDKLQKKLEKMDNQKKAISAKAIYQQIKFDLKENKIQKALENFEKEKGNLPKNRQFFHWSRKLEILRDHYLEKNMETYFIKAKAELKERYKGNPRGFIRV